MWRFIILSGCVLTFVVAAQECTKKIFPSSISPHTECQPDTSTGIWHRYRMLAPEASVLLNHRATVTIIGPTTTPLTTEPAVAYWVNEAWSSPESEDVRCQSQYYMGMYSTGGKKVGFALSAADDYTIHPANVIVAYTDNKNIMIEYGCIKKNDKDAKLCDTPMIHAESRIRPDQMTTEDQAAYDKILNDVFAPYCVTVDDIPKQPYDASKPFCDFIEPPICTTRMIDGLRKIVVTKDTTAKAKSKSLASNSTCKWPLVIPGLKSHQPQKVVGKWYMYRKLYSSEPATINQQYIVHNIGRGELPLSDISAEYQWIEYSQYESPDDSKCRTGYWTGAVGAGGQQIGFGVSTLGPRTPVLNNMNGLYYDNAKFSLGYGCIIPNTQTKICEEPWVYASVRTTPNKLATADKANLDKIINSFFNKYGCSARDIPLSKYVDSKPFCKFEGPNECVSKAIKGFEYATIKSA